MSYNVLGLCVRAGNRSTKLLVTVLGLAAGGAFRVPSA